MTTEKHAFVVDEDIVVERIEIRHPIHRAPELASRERQTSTFVAERLRSLGLEVTQGIAGTGVAGALTLGAGPMIGFRAGRTGDAVLPGPIRQCDAVQGIRQRCTLVRDLGPGGKA